MSYSSLKIEKFSENSRFFTLYHIQRLQNKLFWPLLCLFQVFCHLHPAHLRIHKDQLSNNKKTQHIIRPEKLDFFQIAHQTQQNCFFFYQTTIIKFLQTKTNNKKKLKFFKEKSDKTFCYLIDICNIQAVRDYKKYRYISLSKKLQMYLILLNNIWNERKF